MPPLALRVWFGQGLLVLILSPAYMIGTTALGWLWQRYRQGWKWWLRDGQPASC